MHVYMMNDEIIPAMTSSPHDTMGKESLGKTSSSGQTVTSKEQDQSNKA